MSAFLDEFLDVGIGEAVARSLLAVTDVDVSQLTIANEDYDLLIGHAEQRSGCWYIMQSARSCGLTIAPLARHDVPRLKFLRRVVWLLWFTHVDFSEHRGRTPDNSLCPAGLRHHHCAVAYRGDSAFKKSPREYRPLFSFKSSPRGNVAVRILLARVALSLLLFAQGQLGGYRAGTTCHLFLREH